MLKKHSFWIRGLIALIIAACCVSCAKSPEVLWQEQYDLGVRYLSENNYEEAVIVFTAAIEIDPNRPEAYAAAAEAYAALGDYDDAIALLDRGYEATKDDALLEQRNILEITNKKWWDKQILVFGHLISLPTTGEELEQLGFAYGENVSSVMHMRYRMYHPAFGSIMTIYDSNMNLECTLPNKPEWENPADCKSMPISEVHFNIYNAMNPLTEEQASAIRFPGNITFSSSVEDVINTYGVSSTPPLDSGSYTLHYATDEYGVAIFFEDERLVGFTYWLNKM